MSDRTSVQQYWERRLRTGVSLATVGWWSFGEAFNRWMYRVRRQVFLRNVRPLVGPEARVLDVGSGSGFYLERWRELGVASITASDMTAAAVAALRERFDMSVEQLDIGDPDLRAQQRFDAISVMDVLFHIVDDERYRTSFRNAASLLVPGGLLIFSDNFLHGCTLRSQYQVSRSINETLSALDDAGFDVVTRRPIFVFMNTPVDSDSTVLRAYWRGLQRVLRRDPTHGNATGAALYLPELLMAALLREGPSTELTICRRRR